MCVTALALLYLGSAGAAQLDYDEYLQRANAAKRRGDWQSAASQLAQAINHPDLPKEGAERSRVHLEYGRAVGALCQFDEAEKFMLRARDIAEKAGSSTFTALYELGAVNLARHRFDEATGYFTQLGLVADRESRARTSPQLLADAYEKFAVALAAIGKTEEAQLRRSDALKLRESSPAAAIAGTLTPIGTQCQKS